MRHGSLRLSFGCSLLFTWLVLSAPAAYSQSRPAELRLRIASSKPGKFHPVPAVAWLRPLPGTPVLPFVPAGPYTLLQKNRTFIPHLQVIPVGSVVQFPNADPFFHNVFSLFDGKRFDLGLYEAGSSKSVTFSRDGVSYIFCNIHPEMSAVIISITTPTYAIANAADVIDIRNVPPGDYRLELWVEGVPRTLLQEAARNVHLAPGLTDIGELKLPTSARAPNHTNKFGMPYAKDTQEPY